MVEELNIVSIAIIGVGLGLVLGLWARGLLPPPTIRLPLLLIRYSAYRRDHHCKGTRGTRGHQEETSRGDVGASRGDEHYDVFEILDREATMQRLGLGVGFRVRARARVRVRVRVSRVRSRVGVGVRARASARVGVGRG